MRRLAALAGLLLAVVGAAGCGRSSGGNEPMLPPLHTAKVEPHQPQRLAFVAGRRIGIVEGERIRYVAKLPRGAELIELDWSGDGRRLAWTMTLPSEDIGTSLEMVDIETGARQIWHGVEGSPDPGLEGIDTATYQGQFAEFLPSGERRVFPFHLHHLRRRDYSSATGVDAVMPFGEHWLVLAEHTVFAGRGGPVRAFLYDPQTARFRQVAKGSGFPFEPVHLPGGGAAWVEGGSGGACPVDDEVGTLGAKAPELPVGADRRRWIIIRLLAAEGISVLARRTGERTSPPEKLECTDDHSYSWLTLKNGRWTVRERGLLELDVAADGRIARVRGSLCGDLEACSKHTPLGPTVTSATVEDPDGEIVTLPTDTERVRFSPALPSAAPDYGGEGPALSDGMKFDLGGLGPLHMGMDPSELQSGTSTPLTFQLDSDGCGTVTPTDYRVARALGIEGEIRSDRLTAIRITTLDGPPTVDEYEDADEEPDPLSDLQPGVGSVRARGPRIEGALRAGNGVDMMLEQFGRPSDETHPSATDAVDYSYELDGGTLLAHADGSGTLRRLELRAQPTPPCYSGGRQGR
jgi:hypothetical protein